MAQNCGALVMVRRQPETLPELGHADVASHPLLSGGARKSVVNRR
jgi:hypothetical protein